LDALAKEADEREGGERREAGKIQRLRADDLAQRGLGFFVVREIPPAFVRSIGRARARFAPTLDRSRRRGRLRVHRQARDVREQQHDENRSDHLAASGGASSERATRRELFLIAREALVTLTVARDTASMSAPTLNGSRMLLPLNCAANCGGSTEKSPYGSWCSTTMIPVSRPFVSMPTRILIGPSYARSSGSSSVVQKTKPSSVCAPERPSPAKALKCGGSPPLGEKEVAAGNTR